MMPRHLDTPTLCTESRLPLKGGAWATYALSHAQLRLHCANLPPTCSPHEHLIAITASSLPSPIFLLLVLEDGTHQATILLSSPSYAFTCAQSMQRARRNSILSHLDFIQTLQGRSWSHDLRGAFTSRKF